MQWTIYCHTHTASGRRYIGQTKLTMQRRWKGHVWNSKQNTTGYGYGHFANAIRKYGPEAFTHEILETCSTQEEADEAEKRWIRSFDAMNPTKGFNSISGGAGRKDGMRNPWDRPEHREKMLRVTIPKLIEARRMPETQEALNEVKRTPEYRAAQSKRSKEAMSRPEVRAKMQEIQNSAEYLARSKKLGAQTPLATRLRSQTHCKEGHEFTPENTKLNTQGSRICKTCKNARERKYYGPLKEKTLKTHCINGHEFTPDNIWWRGTSRCCRACNRERARKRIKEIPHG